MRGKCVTVWFKDRSVAVVTRDVVGYGRVDSAASRFAEAYHSYWPSVRLDAFGAAAHRPRATAAAAATSPQQAPPAAEVQVPSPEVAFLLGTAANEVIPASVCVEDAGNTAAVRTEVEQCSADVSIDPAVEDTGAKEMCVPEGKDETNADNLADRADVDPPEFPEDDLEEREEDEFEPR